MVPTVEWVHRNLFLFRSEMLISAQHSRALGSGSRFDKGVVAWGSPLDPCLFGCECGCLLGKVLILFQHSELYCQLQYGAEHHVGEEWRCSGLERCRYVCKHVSSVIGGHIAPLGEFSSLAAAAWQTAGVAPFSPYRRQYHSSDLSPSACLNVWKQDVLRLLALLGKAGVLIPHPWGARQYGAACWPPASPGSRCHNTSHIPNRRYLLLLPDHTSITVAEWVAGAPNRQESSGWN